MGGNGEKLSGIVRIRWESWKMVGNGVEWWGMVWNGGEGWGMLRNCG